MQLDRMREVIFETKLLCGVCEQNAEKLQQLVQDPASVKKMEERVKEMCDHIPDPLNQQCNAIVDQYLEQAVDYIKTQKPIDLCRTVLLC